MNDNFEPKRPKRNPKDTRTRNERFYKRTAGACTGYPGEQRGRIERRIDRTYTYLRRAICGNHTGVGGAYGNGRDTSSKVKEK